jgi:hypothetical protein
MALNWGTKKREYVLVREIARRAMDYIPGNLMHVEMDVLAAHLNGCPMRLVELLNADDGDFVHDVCGIVMNLDRKTGKLENCFLPRYAK